MEFGPVRSKPSCAVSLSGHLLEVVPSCRYLGVVLTPSLRWDAHVAHILARGHRLFAQSSSWARSEGLTCFLLALPTLHVMFFPVPLSERNSLAIALALWRDLAQRRWGRHLLGWASGTPCASVLYELALPDSLRLSTGRAQALFDRLHSLTAGARVPLPTAVSLSQDTPGTWARWRLSLLQHHAARNPADFGVGPRCSSAVTRRWLHRVVYPLLDRTWFHRLRRGLALLSGIRFNSGAVRPDVLDHVVYNSTVDAGLARWWGLARHGHDLVDEQPGTGDVSQCAFCSSASGDLVHCLAMCPAFSDLRLRWCGTVRVVPAEAAVWARHPWLFTPGHPANSHGTVRGHVQFVGQVCARVHDHLSFPSPPHLSERALRRFLSSVLSVSFSFCQVYM